MNKFDIIRSLRLQLRNQYERAIAALEDATEGATGDDTRAESKYDTRGLESSYLAVGQAEQAEELSRGVSAVENFEFPDFEYEDRISMGALVELERQGELLYYLLAPAGGGLVCESSDGETVTILGPQSPLGQMLEGKVVGEMIEEKEMTILDLF